VEVAVLLILRESLWNSYIEVWPMSTSLRLIGSQVPPTDLRSRPRSWSTVRGNRFGAAVTTPHGHS